MQLDRKSLALSNTINEGMHHYHKAQTGRDVGVQWTKSNKIMCVFGQKVNMFLLQVVRGNTTPKNPLCLAYLNILQNC